MSEERRTAYNPFDNREFRRELTELLDEKLQPIPELQRQVDNHEKSIQRTKGAMAMLSILWTMFLGGLEYFLHRR